MKAWMLPASALLLLALGGYVSAGSATDPADDGVLPFSELLSLEASDSQTHVVTVLTVADLTHTVVGVEDPIFYMFNIGGKDFAVCNELLEPMVWDVDAQGNAVDSSVSFDVEAGIVTVNLAKSNIAGSGHSLVHVDALVGLCFFSAGESLDRIPDAGDVSSAPDGPLALVPEPVLTVDVSEGLAPLEVMVSADALNPDTIASWELFQDGVSIGTGDENDLPTTFDVTLDDAGEYAFAMFIIDDNNAISNGDATVLVHPALEVVTDGPYETDEGFGITLTATPIGGYPGEVTTCSWSAPVSADSCSVQVVLDDAGTYPLTVTATQGAATATVSTSLLVNPVDPDVDGDGILNGDDNCSTVANAGQEDADEDGIGDACDQDRDGDNISNALDNCPDISNPGQADQDGDDIGDICDVDRDGDSLTNDSDNCPDHADPSQADQDGDGLGDLCDGDADGDGVQDGLDYFPGDSGESLDTDRDGVGDASGDGNAAADGDKASDSETDTSALDDKESPGLPLLALLATLAVLVARRR